MKTPGPWRYEVSTKTIRSVPANYWLATMDSFDGAVDHEANARLIAAAPDLLDALKDELDALAIWIRATSDLDVLDGMAISISKIRAAIAKAEG